MKFEIRNRWSGNVQFTADIDCSEDTPLRFKIGLAVRWAFKSDAVLRDADLSGADLSDADLSDAVLSDADLSDAVLRGAVLRDAVLRGAVLRDAVLRDADLSGADLRGAVLRDADLSGADLRGADLRGADLRGAVLRDADLSGADLSGADLRGVPTIENIHQKVYEAASQPHALDMNSWHATDACGTTHCRAGWVIALAGDAGRAMEFCMGTPAAAAMIYLASDPKIEKIPNFYCDNAEALEDMKRLAEAEAA